MIDAHHHLWQLGAHGCVWPTPDLPAIYRDHHLPEFEGIARTAGVSGSVLVQSQTCDADTDYLLQLATGSGFIKAVVGWVDLASPTAPARIAQLMQPSATGQASKLRSLRPMLQALAEDNWILRPELEPALAAMKQHQLALDALVYTRHLPFVYEFARRHPELPLVIDHAAKPPVVASNQLAPDWCDAMAKLAALPNVYCKVSGLPTEAGASQEPALLARYITWLYAQFGAQRLMWGSDWPVLGMAANPQWASYSGWLALVRRALSGCAPEELESIFSSTSSRFYRLN